jgi:hypothetical protein
VSAALLTPLPSFAMSNATRLHWGRPAIADQQRSKSAAYTRQRPTKSPTVRRTPTTVRDSDLMAAVWEVERLGAVQQASDIAHRVVDPSVGDHRVVDHSVVIERKTPVYDYDPPEYDPLPYDPFDEDDRIAQLPDDPFDEPAEESNAIPEAEDDIESVEEALEAEIERRRSPVDSLDENRDEPARRDPLEDLNDLDPLDEDNVLERDLDLEKMQPDPEELQLPDFEYEYERNDSDRSDELTPEELAEQQKELEEEQRKSQANCRQELADLAVDRISSIDLDIGVKGNAGEDYPFECQVSSGTHQPREWPQITYNWKAAALCHKPLYFEQVQLERYGHSWGPYLQPIMSGVHFFGTLPVLPYKMGIRTPCECVYTLGYYRPGSCAPYMIEPIPFTWRAALFQSGFVTGTAFTIP